MDKIGCNQNKPIVLDTNVTKIIWLRWLFEMIKMSKATSWRGILILFSYQIKLSVFIYNDIIKLSLKKNYRWIQNDPTFHLGFNARIFIF